jgi:hypothetical protein
MIYTKISRALLASMNFRPFEQTDYYGFAGVSSPCPMIGEVEAEGITVIIDGDYAELYAYDGCANFDCVDTCANIRELPFKTEKQLRIEAEIEAMEKSLAALKAELN